MAEHSEGGSEKFNWVPMRETVVFESYEKMLVSLLKEMNERNADAAGIDIIHIPDGFPELASARAELVIEKRGSGAPTVTFKGDSTPLYPAHEFKIWWQKHFGQKLSFDRASFRLSKISRERPRGAPQKEVAAPEDVQVAEVESAPPTPNAVEESQESMADTPEYTFRTFREMQRSLFEFLAENQGTKISRANEGFLVVQTIDQEEPLRIRIEQPNPRARVVWAYPENGNRFSLVSPMAERELDAVLRSLGRDRAREFRLEAGA